MLLKHKSTIPQITINRWYVYHSQSWVVYDIVLPPLPWITYDSHGHGNNGDLRFPVSDPARIYGNWRSCQGTRSDTPFRKAEWPTDVQVGAVSLLRNTGSILRLAVVVETKYVETKLSNYHEMISESWGAFASSWTWFDLEWSWGTRWNWIYPKTNRESCMMSLSQGIWACHKEI